MVEPFSMARWPFAMMVSRAPLNIRHHVRLISIGCHKVAAVQAAQMVSVALSNALLMSDITYNLV